MTDSRGSLGPDFLKIYVTGVVGWMVGMVALFGASWAFSKPETVPIAMLWVISHSWAAYLFGLVLMVIRGVLSKAPLMRPLLAYVLPVVVLASIAGVCLAVYPDAGFRDDVFTYLPVVLVFYCLGCIWVALGRMDGGSFVRAVVPSLIGGLIILGFVAVPAFASDGFRYHGAFHLHTTDAKVTDGVLVFDGILEIRKAGNYEFAAPRYFWMEEMEHGEGSDVEMGEIQWGEAGQPREGAVGSFPLRVTWKKGIQQEGEALLSPFGDYITLDVSRPDQGGKVVYCISATEAKE
jgi:hypothetical protein